MDSWGFSSATSVLEKCQLEPVVQSSQVVSISTDRPQPLGSLFQYLTTLTTIFFLPSGYILCFITCVHCLLSGQLALLRKVAMSSSFNPVKYFYPWIMTFIFARLNCPSSLSLSTYGGCSSPLIIFVALFSSFLLLLSKPQMTPVCCHSQDPFLWLNPNIFCHFINSEYC